MILGIGTDIVRIGRFEDMLAKHGQRAAERILASSEMEAFQTASQPARLLAKRFAAKEALAKALGTGVRAPVLLTSIAIEHDALGKPGFIYSDALASLMAEKRCQAHLSISDEHDYAIAYVVLESAC